MTTQNRISKFVGFVTLFMLAQLMGCNSSQQSVGVNHSETNESEQPRLKWTPFTVGLVDSRVRDYRIVILNFGSADGPGKSNEQYDRNEKMLEQKHIQDYLAERNVELFRGKESYIGVPRGFTVDDFNDGDNQAMLIMYSARKPYEPLLISPATEEKLKEAIEGVREWIDYNKPKEDN